MSKKEKTRKDANISKVLKEQATRNRSQRAKALRVQALLEGVQRNGLSGLVQTVYVMIDPDQPSVECLAQADADFAGASSAEEVWDAALAMSECLLEAKIEDLLDVPEPEEPPERDPVPEKAASAGNLVLAALLVLLHGQMKTNRPKST